VFISGFNYLNFILESLNVKMMTREKLFNMMQQQNLPNINKKLEFLENYLLTFENYLNE